MSYAPSSPKEPTYSRMTPIVSEGVAVKVRVTDVLDRSPLCGIARNLVVSAINSLRCTYWDEGLEPDSFSVVKRWTEVKRKRLTEETYEDYFGMYHQLLGQEVKMEEANWNKFCQNIAYLSQLILNHHGEGWAFHRGKSYSQVLEKHLKCGALSIECVKHVLDAYSCDPQGKSRRPPYLEMIMETIFTALFRPEQVEIFPSRSILTLELVERRVIRGGLRADGRTSSKDFREVGTYGRGRDRRPYQGGGGRRRTTDTQDVTQKADQEAWA